MSTAAKHRRVPPLVLTVPEVAQALGISRSLAYQLVAAGHLPHLRLGRRIVIPRSSISRILQQAGGTIGSEESQLGLRVGGD